ncbi:MAG: hypothetical protein EOP06_03860 [Proteobacteria bacterium]|nr:MAG: hypothetical protein EOP06_03860 [Pseudomonadota bacterium]
MKILFPLLLLSSNAFANFTVVSWNGKHIGRPKQDLAQSSILLKSGDIIAFQEVNASDSGVRAIRDIGRNLSLQTGFKYCVGLSEIPSDGKERYAYLWKEGVIAYVTTKGEAMKSCGDSTVTIKLGATQSAQIIREPAIGMFLEIKTGVKFVMGTVHLVPTSKNPENEAPYAFRAMDEWQSKYPRILVGDFNLDASSYGFSEAKGNGYRPSLASGVRTSLSSSKRAYSKAYDNIFVKGLDVSFSSVIDPFTLLSGMDHKLIYKVISDHAPIEAVIVTE